MEHRKAKTRCGRWKKALAIGAVAAVVGGLCGCSESGGSGSVSQTASQNVDSQQVGERQTILSQTENVGVCTDTKKSGYQAFSDFLSVAEPFALTPGFQEKLVSQGMDQNSETGNIYVSGYFKTVEDNPFSDTENPSAIAVMNGDGVLIGEYVMYNADGTAFTSHMGGVAVSEDTLYVSGPQQKASDGTKTYWIAAIPLSELEAEGHHEVTVETMYQVPVQPSFLNYSEGTLWVGNFYMADNSSYAAPATVGTIYADNDKEKFGSYLLGYDLTEKGSARMESSDGSYAMPDTDKVFAMTDRIQGMTCLSDGTIVLSRSYGRKNNSQLMVYDPTQAATKTLTLNGTDYTCILLEAATCQTKVYTVMPMTEGITVKTDGNGREVLVLLESGAAIYSGDGTYDSNKGVYRTDYIWKIDLP